MTIYMKKLQMQRHLKKTYLSTTIHKKKSVKKLAPIQIKNGI